MDQFQDRRRSKTGVRRPATSVATVQLHLQPWDLCAKLSATAALRKPPTQTPNLGFNYGNGPPHHPPSFSNLWRGSGVEKEYGATSAAALQRVLVLHRAVSTANCWSTLLHIPHRIHHPHCSLHSHIAAQHTPTVQHILPPLPHKRPPFH